jgi:uncharacterized protein YraI
MRRSLRGAFAAALVLAQLPAAMSDGGPDYWAVTGIPVGGALNIYREPTTEAPILGAIPWLGTKLANLGCIHEPTYREWLAMSEEERRQAAERRWCRIRYCDLDGWVRGKFLRED